MSNSANRWQAVAHWFLLISYTAGSAAFAIGEAMTGIFSERFDYPPEFLYLVAGMQIICALLLRVRAAALWSIAVLTILAIGAAYSHFRIGSPMTSIPALAYIAIQAWYGLRISRR